MCYFVWSILYVYLSQFSEVEKETRFFRKLLLFNCKRIHQASEQWVQVTRETHALKKAQWEEIKHLNLEASETRMLYEVLGSHEMHCELNNTDEDEALNDKN